MNFYRKLIVSILLLMATLISQDMTTIAVMDLDPRGLSEYEAASLTDRIRTNLVGLRLFEVVDRGNMEAILKEQDFQLSGCTSSECVVEVGKLLGVRKILAGSVGKIGTFYTLELNITDVESGRIERSSSYEVEGNVGHLLKGSENALQKLLGLTVSAERGVISTERRAQSSENGAGSRAGGRLVIESKPPGAVLTMDGNDMGKTPFNMQNVPPGSHTIRLSKNDFQDMNAFIDVKVGEINRFNYDLKSIFGGIEINCAIKDANIYFDDKLRRISSFPDYRIPRGVYMLRIEHPHYSSFETTLNIISGDTVRVKPELKRIVGDIEVEVEADPSTALRARGEAELAHRSLGEGEIFINGGLIG
ncbi:MAG: PEGA domain-containing protein, partial [Candidatus Marinimicrobia bacterium]|nr:PEGA domain-containing protein [Candidatus Neomarinimicrobiota bacterium]